MPDKFNQLFNFIQNAFPDDENARKQLLLATRQNSDFWKTVNPDTIPNLIRRVENQEIYSKFVTDWRNAPNKVQFLATALQETPAAQESAEPATPAAPAAQKPEEPATENLPPIVPSDIAPPVEPAPEEPVDLPPLRPPFKLQDLGQTENIPTSLPNPQIVAQQQAITPEAYQASVIKDLNRISKNKNISEQELDRLAEIRITRAAAEYHRAKNQEKYAPGRLLSAEALFARRAMIEAIAPQYARMAAVEEILDSMRGGAEESPQTRELRRRQLLTMSKEEFAKTVDTLQESAKTNIQQIQKQYSDVKAVTQHLATLDQEDLLQIFSKAPMSVRQDAGILVSMYKMEAITDVLKGSKDLAQSFIKSQQRDNVYLNPVTEQSLQTARRIYQWTAPELEQKYRTAGRHAATFLAAEYERYGIDPYEIRSGDQLRSALRRAAGIELLTAGLQGRDKQASQLYLKSATNEQIENMLQVRGFSEQNINAMQQTLIQTGENLERSYREREEALAYNQMLRKTAKQDKYLSSFVSALRSVGMDVVIDIAPFKSPEVKGPRYATDEKRAQLSKRYPAPGHLRQVPDLRNLGIIEGSRMESKAAQLMAQTEFQETLLPITPGPDIRLPSLTNITAAPNPEPALQLIPPPVKQTNIPALQLQRKEEIKPTTEESKKDTTREPINQTATLTLFEHRLTRLEKFANAISNGVFSTQT